MLLLEAFSGMQYERMLCAGFDFSWFWFSIKLISFKFWSEVLIKNLFGFELSKKSTGFSACPKTHFKSISNSGLKITKKNPGNRKSFLFFLNISGVGEEMISGFKAALVFDSRSFSSKQVSFNNFLRSGEKEVQPGFSNYLKKNLFRFSG